MEWNNLSPEDKAHRVKEDIISSTRIDEDNIKVSQEIKYYYRGTNRNASSGEVSWFVFVDLLDNKNVDDSVNQGLIGFMKNYCKSKNGLEYLGKANSNEGFSSTNPNLIRYNIRVND